MKNRVRGALGTQALLQVFQRLQTNRIHPSVSSSRLIGRRKLILEIIFSAECSAPKWIAAICTKQLYCCSFTWASWFRSQTHHHCWLFAVKAYWMPSLHRCWWIHSRFHKWIFQQRSRLFILCLRRNWSRAITEEIRISSWDSLRTL